MEYNEPSMVQILEEKKRTRPNTTFNTTFNCHLVPRKFSADDGETSRVNEGPADEGGRCGSSRKRTRPNTTFNVTWYLDNFLRMTKRRQWMRLDSVLGGKEAALGIQ